MYLETIYKFFLIESNIFYYARCITREFIKTHPYLMQIQSLLWGNRFKSPRNNPLLLTHVNFDGHIKRH